MIPGLNSAWSLSDGSKERWKEKYLKFKLLGKTTVSPEAKKHLISTSVTWGKYQQKKFRNGNRPLSSETQKEKIWLGFQDRNIPLKIAVCDFFLLLLFTS